MSTSLLQRPGSSSKAGLARLLVPLALLGAILGGLFGSTRPSTATATSALYVSSAKPEGGVDSSQLTNTISSRMYSYYNMAQSNTVLQPVIDKLKLDTTVNELRPAVQASVPEDSMIIQVAVEAQDPAQAATLSNAVRDSLSNAIVEMTPDQTGGSPAIEVFRYQDAAAATSVSEPNVMVWALLGALLGALLATLVQNLLGHRSSEQGTEPAAAPLEVEAS